MRPINFAICLMTMFCTGTALAQEAYLYDSTAKGTYAYDASSTGKLALIKGSPFQTVGSLIGTNGKFLVTADSTFVFSYAVESSGAIGKEVSEINTQLYNGYQCGTIGGTKYGYVLSPAALLILILHRKPLPLKADLMGPETAARAIRHLELDL